MHNSIYGNNYNYDTEEGMLRDRRRSSRAENNFQLRVRKRGQSYSMPSAESNFQLRVRKDFLDRIREVPQLRSSAEDNFQLRVRRGGQSLAERNFQLRVRKAGDRRSMLEKIIRDRTLRSAAAADDNFQLRVRKAQPMSMAENNFQLRVRRSPEET